MSSIWPNHQVLRTGGSRSGLAVGEALVRLPPVADLRRWAHGTLHDNARRHHHMRGTRALGMPPGHPRRAKEFDAQVPGPDGHRSLCTRGHGARIPPVVVASRIKSSGIVSPLLKSCRHALLLQRIPRMKAPNHHVLRTGGSRCGLAVVGALVRLPPVADLSRWR